MSPATRSVSATWNGDYRCEVQAGAFTLPVDEPASVGGSDTGPQPTELFLASIASCFTLAFSWAARKRDVELEHLSVEVTGTYDGPRFRRIDIEVDAGCDPAMHQRLIESAERVCYVTNTIRDSPPIAVTTKT